MGLVRNPRTGELENVDNQEYAEKLQRVLKSQPRLGQDLGESEDLGMDSSEASPVNGNEEMFRALMQQKAADQALKDERGYGVEEVGYTIDEPKPKFQKLRSVMKGR
jgi:hypothetical protein